MKIEAKYDNPERPQDGVNIVVSGAGGDKKQPVAYLYTSVTVSKADARRLGQKLLDLGSKP